MSTVVKAKVSKLLDRAEDPRRRSIQLREAARAAGERQEGDRRSRHRQEAPADAGVDAAAAARELDTQARQALAAGKEDLARTASSARTSCRPSWSPSTRRSHEPEAQQQKLTDSEQKLRAKIEAFRTKKEVIKAQYSAAEAEVRISEAATGVGEEMADVGLAMQRAVDKTET